MTRVLGSVDPGWHSQNDLYIPRTSGLQASKAQPKPNMGHWRDPQAAHTVYQSQQANGTIKNRVSCFYFKIMLSMSRIYESTNIYWINSEFIKGAHILLV
jgi:hypothetical protein